MTNNLIKLSFVYTQLIDQAVLFITIQFSMLFVCTQFQCQTVLFDQKIGPYKVLPLQASVNQRAMAMKGFSIFS